MTTVAVTHYTDPNCPFAYAAEPQIWRLKWRYGDQLTWTTRMVGLAETREVYYAKKHLTPEVIAGAYAHLGAESGMPFDTSVRAALPATVPACREIVAAREHGGAALGDRLLRELRLQGMVAAQVIDEPATLRAASDAAGIDRGTLDAWIADPATEAALQADLAAARAPDPASLQLTDRLAGWEGGWRYTCPSLVLQVDGRLTAAPGYQPAKSYDVAVANAAPDLVRAEPAADAGAVLTWAGEPLATAEVAAIMELSLDETRTKLAESGASETPRGTDSLWTL